MTALLSVCVRLCVCVCVFVCVCVCALFFANKCGNFVAFPLMPFSSTSYTSVASCQQAFLHEFPLFFNCQTSTSSKLAWIHR